MYFFFLKFDILKRAKILNIRLGLLTLINVVLCLISLDFQTVQANCGYWNKGFPTVLFCVSSFLCLYICVYIYIYKITF